MIRLLIVDDHVMFREGLKQILAKQTDMQVMDEVGNGSDALKKIRDEEYDAVILDISMPGKSGWEILADLKNEKPELPVLILSMYPEDQFAVRMLKAGASGYLTKESAADELITAIRKVASGGRYVSSTLAERLAYILDAHSDKLPHQLLSNREFQVMCMLASGKTLKEIADELCLSEKTITTYRARILEKMQIRNNVELTHYVIQHKLLG
jgi:two-component system, NarL family, invasion response regulator UvrY